MGDRVKCGICGADMVLIGARTIAGTKYEILKCEECHHEIARSVE
jgi:uncharacterized protein YlaI